jgi:hypothetical protein
MFKILKRLMGSGNKEREDIPFSMIDVWFETKLKETALSKDLATIFNGTSRSLQRIAIALKRIASHKLKDLPDDHHAVIEQHRSDYIKKLQSFIQHSTLEKRDVESIVNYGETLAAALAHTNEFIKPHLSLIQKFFSDEESEIADSLAQMRTMQEQLDDLIKRDQGVLFVQDIKKRIHAIKRKNKDVAELQEKLRNEETKQKEIDAYKSKLETDLDDLKTASEYEKYDQLMGKKIKLDKELERDQEHMKLLFAPLVGAFASYDQKELGADRALARQYAADPLASLHHDSGLWLFTLLQVVSLKLPEIELDERKRLKIRQSILSLSEEVVKNYLAKYNVLKEGLSQINRQIMMNTTTTKIGDIKYKLQHVEQQLTLIAENTQKCQAVLAELNVEKDLLMLEKKLQVFSPVVIT